MNFSPEKLLLVGILALVVLGPNRLPQAARTVAKLLADFRRVSASLQGEVTQALAEPREAMQKSMGEFGLPDLRGQMRNTITDVFAAPPPTTPAAPANGSNGAAQSPIAAQSPVAAQAPIVDPSRPLEFDEAPTPASGPRTAPLPPDDPTLN